MFGIQSIFGAYCLTGLKIISCDSRDPLFWNCHYFLEQPLCTAANMPWILLLHITVILLCQGRTQPHGLESVSADLMPQYSMFKSGRNRRVIWHIPPHPPQAWNPHSPRKPYVVYVCVSVFFLNLSLNSIILQL